MDKQQVINILVICAALYYGWKYFSKPKLIKDNLQSHYDYIVVGAGTAGSVMANRLTEESSVNVAVLEAGKEETAYPESFVPLISLMLQKTGIDWKYETVPQAKACKGLVNNVCAWPRGKSLGGSSQINGMWYVRGNRHDYDRWDNVFGAEGWSYADVLPYFKKSETHENKTFVNSGYHGDSGPWNIKVVDTTPQLQEIYLKAYAESGSKILTDINGKEQEGFSKMHAFISTNGVRSGSASAFLRPAMRRKNLDVITEAHVTRIIFSDHEKRAVGVEYIKNGELQTVYSNKEIILSAGTIGSPHILMLSGVGHKQHLEQFGIKCIADLPVGDNLQDHVSIFPADYIIEQPLSSTLDRTSSFMEYVKYKLFRNGLLSSPGWEAVGFYRSEHQPKDDPRPYLEAALATGLAGNHQQLCDLFLQVFNLKEETMSNWFSQEKGKHGFMELVSLQRPASRGTIRLKSGNPLTHPLIDPKYLDLDLDIENLLSGVKHARKNQYSNAYKEFGAKLVKNIHPGCKHIAYDSDDYWRCFIRHNTFSTYHPTSTCKMGRRSDNTTVVDLELRVHGIQGLRVADASIMPEVTTGNTNAPTVMIAEKAADLIRGRKLPPITDL